MKIEIEIEIRNLLTYDVVGNLVKIREPRAREYVRAAGSRELHERRAECTVHVQCT